MSLVPARFRRRTVQAAPADPGPAKPGAPAELPGGPASPETKRPETPRTRAFMFVVEDEARTRRTVRLVFAVGGAAVVLLCVLVLLAAVLGPTAFAVGGATLAAVARKLARSSPPTP
jgi:hypothetical protein